jgi:ketosteroid isomerase-like protein
MTMTRQLGMARLRRTALAVGLAFTIIGASAQAPGSAKTAVLAANAHFYAALNAMFKGDAGPIEEVWSHASYVTYMGPAGGFDSGWSAVRKDWESQTALKLGGHIQPVDVHAFVGQEIAVVSDYEEGENTNVNGKTVQVKLRATNIYRKENGQWKMIGHHTDLLPYL